MTDTMSTKPPFKVYGFQFADLNGYEVQLEDENHYNFSEPATIEHGCFELYLETPNPPSHPPSQVRVVIFDGGAFYRTPLFDVQPNGTARQILGGEPEIDDSDYGY